MFTIMHNNWVMTDGVSCAVSHFAPIGQSIRFVTNDQTSYVASSKYYLNGPKVLSVIVLGKVAS